MLAADLPAEALSPVARWHSEVVRGLSGFQQHLPAEVKVKRLVMRCSADQSDLTVVPVMGYPRDWYDWGRAARLSEPSDQTVMISRPVPRVARRTGRRGAPLEVSAEGRGRADMAKTRSSAAQSIARARDRASCATWTPGSTQHPWASCRMPQRWHVAVPQSAEQSCTYLACG